jgi:hypothetical protein
MENRVISPRRAIVTALIVLASAACGTGSPGSTSIPGAAGTPSAPATAAALSYDDSSTAFCAAFTSLIRAVGNPDLNTPSVLSKSLDDAVAAGDVVKAQEAAAAIKSLLETGRQQAATASGWVPAGPATDALGHVLVAFEAQVAAKLAAAGHIPGAIDPQAAFEQAGGITAWSALLQAVGTMPIPSEASPKSCPAFSGTP